MKIIRYNCILLFCILVCGCGTAPGHFALIDLDGRSDTQRAADSPAEQAHWTGQRDAKVPEVKEKSWWMNVLSSIGSVINFRLQLLSVDWGETKPIDYSKYSSK